MHSGFDLAKAAVVVHLVDVGDAALALREEVRERVLQLRDLERGFPLDSCTAETDMC